MQINTTVQEVIETTTTESVGIAPEVEAQRITIVRKTGVQISREVSERILFTGHSDDPHFGQFTMVEPELVSAFQLRGWFPKDQDDQLVIKQPFTRVLENKPYEVVRLRHYDHTMFDTAGVPLPVAKKYDYINGRVSDYNFDLKALLQHLQGRADVTLHTERFSEKLIHRIPSYNAGDTTGYYSLEFTWHPDRELYLEYRRLSDKMDSFEQRDVAHRLMGNDQFRITPPVESEDDPEGLED